jgi:aminoglycoside phosphotransferase (APT) family kinase protein
VVQSTHDIRMGDRTVVKRYHSWAGGEHLREWAGLTLLDRHAPGLAPCPLEQRYAEGAPEVVMTRVPGESLGGAPLDPEQVAALGAAMRRMRRAVPDGELGALDERRSGPRDMVAMLRAWVREPREPVTDEVDEALVAAARLLASGDVDAMTGPLPERAFAHADGNLGNIVWDGERCCVVDFEDSGLSDPAYEVADLLEHVSVWLPGLLEADALVPVLDFEPAQVDRLRSYRRLMSVFWLLMLLPGNPAHHRNPVGSLERQARRLLDLL